MIPECLLPIVALEVPAEAPSDSGFVKKFDLKAQEKTNWCWAAAASGVASFYRQKTLRQCKVATDVLFETLGIKCCNDPSGCDKPAKVRVALAKVGHLRKPVIQSALSLNALRSEIPGGKERGHPVGCGLSDRDGGGHVVVIYGWDVLGGKTRVHLRDPAGGGSRVEVRSELLDRVGYDWAQTYLTEGLQ